MIANTEIIDGTLYPTVVDDREEMEETYRMLAEQGSDADDEGGEEDGSDGKRMEKRMEMKMERHCMEVGGCFGMLLVSNSRDCGRRGNGPDSSSLNT